MWLLRSESPSSKCAKLHTVAANNNRDHMPWSLYCCLFAPHILYMGVILRAHPFVVNRAFNATPIERLQQWQILVWLKLQRCEYFNHWIFFLSNHVFFPNCAKYLSSLTDALSVVYSAKHQEMSISTVGDEVAASNATWPAFRLKLCFIQTQFYLSLNEWCQIYQIYF